ncbi:hypothetical protein CerSpe_208090 [Prunus speciosa]
MDALLKVVVKSLWQSQLFKGVTWTDEGLVKRITGVTLSTRVSVHFENTMLWKQPGCFISADTTISHARREQISEVDSEKKELVPPKDVGLKIASVLLGEIGQGGVVDSNLQGLLFLLCALCTQDVSKDQVGKLSPYGIDTLRNINDFLGVKFFITPCASTSTVLLKCVGCGLRNLSRKIS